ncbi:MAG: DUF1952 domain-containing protein [Caldilinea sp.]|nr:DUF1952 domain-containing protein [Caldilinea sp.]MDW8442765.1 DUF1952 domain-containing protein [Caldilineaceae bacterium]
MTVRVEHDYYGVPVWLMLEYLTQLGGRPTGENRMEGDGWRAELRPAPRRQIGSLSVGGATVVFAGEQATLDALFEQLHRKTLRGGG